MYEIKYLLNLQVAAHVGELLGHGRVYTLGILV